jgi:MFS transporter, Spinster family, sphingosine-1-phosphate transporter
LNPQYPPPQATKGTAGANLALALLLTINLFNYIDRSVLAAVLPTLMQKFIAPAWMFGLLTTVFIVSYMCFAPLFGWLADRYRRWALISVGVILWSLASGASGLAVSIGMMLATRAFVGIGEAAYGPVAPTIIADMYPIERRGRTLAWFYAAIPVGSALGFLLGSAVLGVGLSWRWAFLLVVPPGLFLGAVSFFKRDPLREDAAARGHEDHQPVRFADYKKLLHIPSYVLNTAGMTAMTFALGGIAVWMPTYIVWRRIQAGMLDPADTAAVDKAAAAAGSVFGPIVVVAGLVGTLVGGWAGDKLRDRWPGSYFLVSGIAMLIAFPLMLLLPVTPFPLAWGLIFVACFCLFFNTGPTNTILANVTHPSIRAAGYALNIFVIHILGDAISPYLMPVINGIFEGPVNPVILAAGPAGNAFRGNMDAGFVAVSFTILLSGLLWLCGTRYLQRDTERVLAGEMPR